MEVTYKFVADGPYYRTVINRYYRQRPLFFRFWVRYGFFSLIAAGLFLGSTEMLSPRVVIIAVICSFLATIGMSELTKMLILHRLRARKDFGTEIEVIASEECVTAIGNQERKNWTWTAYPHSVRYADGILLVRAGVIRWLPDAAIRSGSADDATALVGSKTTLRHVS